MSRSYFAILFGERQGWTCVVHLLVGAREGVGQAGALGNLPSYTVRSIYRGGNNGYREVYQVLERMRADAAVAGDSADMDLYIADETESGPVPTDVMLRLADGSLHLHRVRMTDDAETKSEGTVHTIHVGQLVDIVLLLREYGQPSVHEGAADALEDVRTPDVEQAFIDFQGFENSQDGLGDVIAAASLAVWVDLRSQVERTGHATRL